MRSADATAYRARWRRVAERERAELRAASALDKLRQVAALMASVDALGWRSALDDDAQVHARWQRLRRRLDSLDDR